VTVIATRPLTRNEEWTVMKRDSLVVFRKGEPVLA
jgi:predicted glutamine amidotransferase